MSWTCHHQSTVPYVESHPHPASLPYTPAQGHLAQLSTPTTQARLTGTPLRGPGWDASKAPVDVKQVQEAQARGSGLQLNIRTPVQNSGSYIDPRLATPANTVRQAISTAATVYTPHSAVAGHPTVLAGPYLQTPPHSAEQFRVPQPQQRYEQFQRPHPAMTQRRMSHQGQRPLMGPPETPSRGMIPQSPHLFPNVQFSPDLFAHPQQMMEPQSAPVYPQQRLFWDPATTTPLQSTPQQFHTPIAFPPNDFNTSFETNANIMGPNFGMNQAEMPYDLPTTSQPMHNSFLDVHQFVNPATFHTSPQPPLAPVDNPTQFLSSPARRFGGDSRSEATIARPPIPDLPAYHHQIQEAKREHEMLARQRRRSRTRKRSTDEDLIMKSVRRALSPKKISRPNLSRSNTFTGVQSDARRSANTFDTISTGSSVSSRSTRAGRSLPLKRVSNPVRRVSESATLRPSSAMSLEIDRNGVARTILRDLPEDTDESLEDGYSTEELPSDDDADQQMLYSFSADASGSKDSISGPLSSTYLSMDSDRVARVIKDPALDPRLSTYLNTSTIRRARGETITSSNADSNPTNAQQALRALIQDRSRSASSHASTSSMQFHSSPPLQQGQLPPYNVSPTTITDPGLATPSTDVDSVGGPGQMRCVCNSASAEGNLMLQCDSCTKWLHARCVGLTNKNIPDVFLCPFCEKTPMRGGTIRSTMRQASFHQSPLAHKSNRLR